MNNTNLINEAEKQINQCLNLLSELFTHDLLGVYLYGSSIVGGLQLFSDIDLFVVLRRSTTPHEKAKLAMQLLKISGHYLKRDKFPIEMTIVEKSAINPWYYPPRFDFQYGDWLREQFECGNIEPWPTKEMPDLAVLITQLLLASKTLKGADPDQLLCKIPYSDFIAATTDALPHFTLETDSICSKLAAAEWAIHHLPEKYQLVLNNAKAIYTGKQNEEWGDIRELLSPCAAFMLNQIHNKLAEIKYVDHSKKSIKLA